MASVAERLGAALRSNMPALGWYEKNGWQPYRLPPVFTGYMLRNWPCRHLSRTRISEVRGKSKLAEHTPIFVNKTADRESLKPGLGPQISVYPALPESRDGSMRQILEPPSTPCFFATKCLIN